MLKYKFKLRKNLNNVQEILCDVLYMSLDLTFISGITSPIYGLINGQNIFIKESDSDNYKEYPINIHNSIRRGYLLMVINILQMKMANYQLHQAFCQIMKL